MQKIILAVTVLAAAALAQPARAELNLTPCDAELAAEISRIDGAIATARSEWQSSANARISASGMSEQQRLSFEKTYTEEAAGLFSDLSRTLEVVAKVRMPLVLPAYNAVICQRLEPLRRVNDEIVVSYRQLLTGLLEVLDQSLARAVQ